MTTREGRIQHLRPTANGLGTVYKEIRIVYVASYVCGIILQFTAAIIALLQVRQAPRKLPWFLIALSSLLIVFRRTATLAEVTKKGGSLTGGEITTLAVSVLFLCGVLLMARFFRDVFENQKALKESELKYHTVADFTYDWELWIDPKGNLLYCSPSCETITGYHADEFINRPALLQEIVHSDDQDAFTRHLNEDRTPDAKSFHSDFRIIIRSGEVRWISHYCVPVTGEDGIFLGRRASNRDITERKKAEGKLAYSENIMRMLINASSDTAALFDDQYRIIMLNSVTANRYKKPVEELIGKNVLELLPPEVVSRRKVMCDQAFHTGNPIRFEDEHKGVILDINICPVPDADGKVRQIAVFARDITEHRRMEQELLKNKTRLEFAVTGAGEGLIDWDFASDLIIVNNILADMLGYSREEFPRTGREFKNLIHPDDRAEGDRLFKEHLEGHSPFFSSELRLRAKSGTWKWVLARGQVVARAANGAPLQYVGTHVDITTIKQAEEALQASEERYRLVAENVSDVIWTMDLSGNFTYCSPSVKHQFGFAPEEVVGLNFEQFMPPDSAAVARRKFDEIIASQQTGEAALTGQLELEIYSKNDTPVWAEITYNIVADNKGRFVCLVGICRDTSVRKRLENALRQSNAELSAIYENAPVMMCLLDENRQVLYVNRAFVEFSGRPERELKAGRACGVLGCINTVLDSRGCGYSDKCRSCSLRLAIDKTFTTGLSQRDIEQTATLDRSGKRNSFTLLGSTALILSEGKANLLLCLQDITERTKNMEERQRLSAAIEQSAEAIVVTELDGTIQFVNPAFERITGYSAEETIGKNPKILQSGRHDEHFYKEMWDTITAGNVWRGRLINRKKDGTLYDEEAVISPARDAAGNIINFVAVKRDVTQELRLESQLRQAQKMEAIGTLAGGIAHDFNNILGGIINYTQIAMEDINDHDFVRDSLDWIMKLSERASDMVRQILAFSRKTEQEKHPIQLQSLIKESIKLLRGSIPANIEILSSIDEQTGCVLADLTQMHQILINLCSNAAYAMKEKGGYIEISLSNCVLHKAAPEFPKLPPGDYVRLTVSDTGTGIEPAILGKIFDPYFTTKQVGEGTGMGLAVVHGIVEAHQGAIAVQSAPEKGASFVLLLPQATAEAQAVTTDERILPRGREHILIVDDEQAMVKPVTVMLKKQGYTVTSCKSSLEALQAFQKNPDIFNLVLSDQTMPQMTGEHLAQELFKIRPGIPVILMTGYSAMIDKEKAQRIGVKALLTKPFPKDMLVREIRKVLDEK